MKNKEFLAKYGSKEHIDKIIDSGDKESIEMISKSPTTHVDHLDKLINHLDTWIRYGVAKNPAATKEQLDKLIKDNDDVRSGVVQNPNATKEHLEKLSTDSVPYTKILALEKLSKRM